MPSRTYEIEGTRITITEADKNAEEAAINLTATIKPLAQTREIATNPTALACIEKYSENAEKLVQANSLLNETMKTQEVVLKFISGLDVDNTVKASVPAIRKFRELKSLLDSIQFPPLDDNLKKIFTPAIIKSASELNNLKSGIQDKFQNCEKAQTTIEKCARAVLAKRKANPNAQVQPAAANGAAHPAPQVPSKPAISSMYGSQQHASQQKAVSANQPANQKPAEQKPKT